MNKLFTKIMASVAGFAMAIGVGVGVVGNREATKLNAEEVSWVASSQNYENSEAVSSASIDSNVSISFTNGGTPTAYYTTGTAVRIYNGGSFTVSTASGTMSNIVLAYELNGTATISCSDSANWTAATKTWSGNSQSVTWTAGTAKHVRLSSVTVTYSSGGELPPAKTNTSLTITAAEDKVELDLANSPDTVQLSALVTYEDNGTQTISNPEIEWNGNNNNVATISETGLVTAVGKGNARFTATYSGDENYYGSNGYIDITVVNSNDVIFNFADLASANSWSNDTKYDPTVDGVSLSASGNSSGKYFSSDDTWRVYNGSTVTITPPSGKSISAVESTPSETFTISNDGSSASKSITATTKFKSITVTLAAAKELDSISASLTDTQKTWRVNDVVAATDFTVVPHYTDGTDGAEITDGSGVTLDNATLSVAGNNAVTVNYGGKSTVVNVNAASATVVAWAVTGSIGETVKSTAYNLEGLTLHAYYDLEKHDEASASVANLYEIIADPAVAGDTPNPNNTISVKVYLKTDTGHENCLAVIENVSAPIGNTPKGSSDNPYSVAEANVAINNLAENETIENAYVSGVISQIDSYSSQYNSITYWISDDGTTANQLKVYSGKGLNGADFNAKENIVVGAIVVITGTLKKYSGTNEFDKNNQQVSYNRPVATGISLNKTSLNMTAGDSETLVASPLPVGAELGEITWSSSNASVATVNASGSVTAITEGSATITATFSTFSSSCTVTVTAIAGNGVIKANNIAVGDVVLLTNDTAKKQLQTVEGNIGTVADYSTEPSSSVAPLTVEAGSKDNTFALKLGEKYLGWTSGNNLYELDEINDSSSWEITFSGTTPTIKNAADNTRKLQYNSSNPRFACYTSSQSAVSLWKVKSIDNPLSTATSYAILQGNETNDGNNVSVDSVSIRFGARIPETSWNAINADWPITDYGVMLTQQTKLGTYNSITEAYAAGERFFTVMNKKSGTAPADYSFYAKIKYSDPANYGVVVCAVPYIVAGGHYYFLDEMTYSVNSMLNDFGEYGSTTLSVEALAVLAGN